jgi:shikimate kinase
MDKIYLVGFMGTGKTQVGKRLAKQLERKFIDIDELIRISENKSIAEIFKKMGEPYFRNLEKKMLLEVSKQQECVVSCGGGIVTDPENIKLMKQTGVVICLSATPDVILKRTKDSSHRPLLNVEDPKEKIRSLLAARQKYYDQADKTIDTSEISVEEVAGLILDFILSKDEQA